MLSSITPLILTFNERENLPRTLARLDWASQIVVLDSFSSDDTCKIARAHRNVELIQRQFDNHSNQWNFGVSQVRTDWVLSLDADYILPDAFAAELKQLNPASDLTAYFARFIYSVNGRPLRSALYPPRAVLFRKSDSTYFQEGHTQLLRTSGKTAFLSTPIEHDDRKTLERWITEQNKYALREVTHLLSKPWKDLNRPDRVRRYIVLAPFLVFFYTLIGKRLILDGWPGWYYVFQRTFAELLLSLRLLEAKLNQNLPSTETTPSRTRDLEQPTDLVKK